MHLCTHDAISSWIQVMPLCINQKGHDSQETVKQTTDVKGGKKDEYSQLTFIRSHSLLFKGRPCLLVRAKFIFNPFVLLGKPFSSSMVLRNRLTTQLERGLWWMRNPADLTLACRRGLGEKCERRGSGESWRRVGGGGWVPEDFGHPCSRGAVYGITLFSAVQSGLVCPDETSILKVARDPSSGINKLNKNLSQSQRIKAGEKFPCLSELSGNGAASQSSWSRMSLRASLMPEPSHCHCHTAAAAAAVGTTQTQM